MARQEFRSPACEEHPSELLRCRHSQQSLGLRSHLDDVFCLLNTPKQRRHALVIGLAFRSEVERARRPLDELHTEATFQARDTFRDCGLGCPNKPAGSAEGARVDGADERDQTRRLFKNRSHLSPVGTLLLPLNRNSLTMRPVTPGVKPRCIQWRSGCSRGSGRTSSIPGLSIRGMKSTNS